MIQKQFMCAGKFVIGTYIISIIQKQNVIIILCTITYSLVRRILQLCAVTKFSHVTVKNQLLKENSICVFHTQYRNLSEL